jgi:hypothetical protein
MQLKTPKTVDETCQFLAELGISVQAYDNELGITIGSIEGITLHVRTSQNRAQNINLKLAKKWVDPETKTCYLCGRPK